MRICRVFGVAAFLSAMSVAPTPALAEEGRHCEIKKDGKMENKMPADLGCDAEKDEKACRTACDKQGGKWHDGHDHAGKKGHKH